ncbi:MAG TPA: transcription elongation factor Spt5 [Thermoplasmata archaeon]|nr:transcription elongation factor Spt5 [Thermoplasmata archaeon]
MQGKDEGIGLLSGEEATGTAPAAPRAAGPVRPVPVPVAAVPTRPPEAPGLLTLKAVDETLRDVTAGTVTSLSSVLTSQHPDDVRVELTAEIAYTSTYPGEGAEWPVRWLLPGKKSFTELVARRLSAPVELHPNMPVAVTVEVTAPVGVRYGDRIEVRLSAQAGGEGKPARLTFTWAARQAVLAIKTSRGYEREVADTLLARAEEKPEVLFALLVPAALRGYVFAEGMSFEGVRELLKGIRKARGLVAGETTLKEVEPLLVPKITVEGFVEGAIVELIAGPFKGEKARVKKIDQGKEEITVELIEAVVPIPVTVRGDHVRMLERGGGGPGG